MEVLGREGDGRWEVIVMKGGVMVEDAWDICERMGGMNMAFYQYCIASWWTDYFAEMATYTAHTRLRSCRHAPSHALLYRRSNEHHQ